MADGSQRGTTADSSWREWYMGWLWCSDVLEMFVPPDKGVGAALHIDPVTRNVLLKAVRIGRSGEVGARMVLVPAELPNEDCKVGQLFVHVPLVHGTHSATLIVEEAPSDLRGYDLRATRWFTWKDVLEAVMEQLIELPVFAAYALVLHR